MATAFILAVVFATPVFSQSLKSEEERSGPGTPHVDLLAEAAEVYASRYNVGYEEALYRLRLQEQVGDLQADLIKEEPDTFAGLWIQHESEYQVIARFTQDGEETIRRYVAGKSLDRIVEVRSAESALKELHEAHNKASRLLDVLGIKKDSWTDVRSNTVKLRITDSVKLNAALQRLGTKLPNKTRVVEADKLASPAVNIYAGLPTNTCSTGFSVRHSSGVEGVLTAGHCSNSQTYRGTTIGFQSELFERFWDLQWHRTGGFADRPWIQGNGNVGVVYGTRGRLSQARGDFVCKRGKTTGTTCGNILNIDEDLSYVPNSEQSFVSVYLQKTEGGPLVLPGDSGGPFFEGGTAFGITSGYSETENFYYGYYTAINYAGNLGVTVKTG